MTITPLTAYRLRGSEPSDRFGFIVAIDDGFIHGVTASPYGQVASRMWLPTGRVERQLFHPDDLLSPLPDHPLPECLAHLRPEPVLSRRAEAEVQTLKAVINSLCDGIEWSNPNGHP